MITIRLTTWVDAPMELCFRLATNVEFNSANATKGAGADTFQVGDTFDRSAWRMGLRVSHTSRIEEVRPFTYFREVMIAGGFRHFEHEHHFAPMDDGTRVRSEVRFSAGFGPLGLLVERILLRRYVMKLLMRRHMRLKDVVESNEWRRYLESGQEPAPGPRSAKIAKMQKFA
jgi:ligand-binding SRPBCC domain-containing protein